MLEDRRDAGKAEHVSLARCCDAIKCLAQRGGTVGVNYTMVSRLDLVFEVVAVVIRPYNLRNCL